MDDQHKLLVVKTISSPFLEALKCCIFEEEKKKSWWALINHNVA